MVQCKPWREERALCAWTVCGEARLQCRSKVKKGRKLNGLQVMIFFFSLFWIRNKSIMKSLENVHCLLPSNLRTSFKWLIEEVEEGLFSFETEAEIFFFFFYGPHPRHMEVPRLGVESELQMPAYTVGTAKQDPSHVCDLHHSLLQTPDIQCTERDQGRNPHPHEY